MSSSWKAYKKQFQPQKKVPKATRSFVQKTLSASIEDKVISGTLNFSFGSITNAWAEYSVTAGIAQGTLVSQRLGTKIKVKSLTMYGTIAAGAAENALDDPYNTVRVIVGTYTGQSATPLATSGITINNVMETGYLGARGMLIQKHLDKYIPLTVTSTEKGAGDGYSAGLKLFKFKKVWKKGLLIQWATDAITYPNKQIMIAMISDSAAIPNPGFTVGYFCLKFEDA